jgi:hypothetical protein
MIKVKSQLRYLLNKHTADYYELLSFFWNTELAFTIPIYHNKQV